MCKYLLSSPAFLIPARGVWWHNGRASDAKLRNPGFDPHGWHQVLTLNKAH